MEIFLSTIFPHVNDIIYLKMSIIISLKIILHLFHHQLSVFLFSSSLLCPLSINRPDSACTSTDVMPSECCWHHIRDTSGLQQLKWQENQAQTSPCKLKTCRYLLIWTWWRYTHHRLKSTEWKTCSSPQSFQPVARWTKLPPAPLINKISEKIR